MQAKQTCQILQFSANLSGFKSFIATLLYHKPFKQKFLLSYINIDYNPF